jgi:hypothetical protein
LDAVLPESDRAKVKALRAEIDELVKAKKEDEAREVEEEAMAYWAIARPGRLAEPARSCG